VFHFELFKELIISMEASNKIQGILPPVFMEKVRNGQIKGMPTELRDNLLNGKIKGLPPEIIEAFEAGTVNQGIPPEVLEKMGNGQMKPGIQHRRASKYSVESVTGAVCHQLNDNRLELSFYADRPVCEFELLPALGEKGGEIHSVPTKEHVTAINVSLDDLKNIHEMLSTVIDRMEQSK